MPQHQRSSLSSAIRWIADLRRQTTALYKLAASAALLTDGVARLESFDGIITKNKLALGQELLAAEIKQLETLRGLGFLQENRTLQQTTPEAGAPQISLDDLTLDALARHASELQQELLAFLQQVLQQRTLHPLQGNPRLQGDLLRLNRNIRTLAIHCDIVSDIDRLTHFYLPDPIVSSPVVLLQMREIAVALVGCVSRGYEPRVWTAFFGTPVLHVVAVPSNEEESDEEKIEEFGGEEKRLEKNIEDSQQTVEAISQIERDLKNAIADCITTKDLARIAKIKPESIAARVAALAKYRWLHPTIKGKKRCFSFREGRVILNNPGYENPGDIIT